MAPTPKSAEATRNTLNQRAARARRKTYISDLERRIANYEAQGVQATQQVQAAARSVAEQNRALREEVRTLKERCALLEGFLAGMPRSSFTGAGAEIAQQRTTSRQHSIAAIPDSGLQMRQDAEDQYPSPPQDCHHKGFALQTSMDGFSGASIPLATVSTVPGARGTFVSSTLNPVSGKMSPDARMGITSRYQPGHEPGSAGTTTTAAATAAGTSLQAFSEPQQPISYTSICTDMRWTSNRFNADQTSSLQSISSNAAPATFEADETEPEEDETPHGPLDLGASDDLNFHHHNHNHDLFNPEPEPETMTWSQPGGGYDEHNPSTPYPTKRTQTVNHNDTSTSHDEQSLNADIPHTSLDDLDDAKHHHHQSIPTIYDNYPTHDNHQHTQHQHQHNPYPYRPNSTSCAQAAMIIASMRGMTSSSISISTSTSTSTAASDADLRAIELIESEILPELGCVVEDAATRISGPCVKSSPTGSSPRIKSDLIYAKRGPGGGIGGSGGAGCKYDQAKLCAVDNRRLFGILDREQATMI